MGDDATQGQSCEEHAATGEFHRKMDVFVGEWDAKATFWMSPDQDPMTTSGRMVTAWVLGERYLEMRYESEWGGGPFEGLGYWGYNTASGFYETVWMDTAGTMMMFDRDGTVSDDGKEFRSSGMVVNPENGKPMRKITITRITNHNAHTYEMFFGDEGQEVKAMEIVYTRA